ncbi:hypothetical protein ACFQQB_56730 [Nonomuraea rubra]|uniref:hypothetical protein n=1 Tax=Nonomuraea rubra TaxID=46180 RepID=UPI00362074A8
MDLRERLAYPLPISVIGHLMGVPEDQRGDFRQIVDNVFDSTLTPEQAQANTLLLFEHIDQLIATKRAHPGDDMTSLLIAARDEESDGTGFTGVELRDTMILMISAGYETTVNVIDQAVFAMLTSLTSSASSATATCPGRRWWRRPCGPSPPSSTCRCASP